MLKVIYLTIVVVMGVTCVIVSLWDKFGSPRLRPFRAGIFITFGLSGIAPATHYSIQNGWEKSINEAALGWLVFMGFLYISGAMLYAFRCLKESLSFKINVSSKLLPLSEYLSVSFLAKWTSFSIHTNSSTALSLLARLSTTTASPIWHFTGTSA